MRDVKKCHAESKNVKKNSHGMSKNIKKIQYSRKVILRSKKVNKCQQMSKLIFRKVKICHLMFFYFDHRFMKFHGPF